MDITESGLTLESMNKSEGVSRDPWERFKFSTQGISFILSQLRKKGRKGLVPAEGDRCRFLPSCFRYGDIISSLSCVLGTTHREIVSVGYVYS